MSKYIAYMAIAMALVALVVGFSSSNSLGGRYHVTQEYFPQGIKAGTSDTEVINSSGQWVGSISATTGAFSSTLGVTGQTTLTGALVANGNFTLGNASTDVGTINGNTTFANVATFSSTTNLAGTNTMTGALTASGTNIFSGGTSITGNATISSTLLTVSAATGTFSGANSFSGTSTFTGEVHTDNFLYGGDITANTDATGTLTAANICDSSVITQTWTASTSTGTLTLPVATASVADCFLTNGDTKDIVFKNLNSVSASTSTLTTNTGMTLYYASGSNGVINGADSALLKFIRISSTALDVLVSPLSQ